MSDQTIETLKGEYEDLGLHVDLCSQRYRQLFNKFDDVEQRLDNIESILAEVRQQFVENQKDTSRQYLSWAGVIIVLLATALTAAILN